MLIATNVQLVLSLLLFGDSLEKGRILYIWLKTCKLNCIVFTNFQHKIIIFSKSQPQVQSLEDVLMYSDKNKECIYKTLLIVRQFYLPYHKIGAHVAIVRSWEGWKLAYAVKKLRQYKTKILKLSPVVNAKSSHNASHSTLGFMQFALIDGCCRQPSTSTSSSIKLLTTEGKTNFSCTQPIDGLPGGAGVFWGKKFELCFTPVQLCVSGIFILHQDQRRTLYLRGFIMQMSDVLLASIINIKLDQS